MQIEFMMSIIIDEMVNKLSIDFSHIVDKYSHNSSFLLSEEFKIYNAVTTTAAAIVILSQLFNNSNLITKVNIYKLCVIK